MAADLQTALYLAARGFYVAPLIFNDKRPSGHWREQSTLDTKTIKDLFVDPYMGWPQKINMLVDPGKSGLVIVDIDDKDGKDGSGDWAKLVGNNPMPVTFTVRTPTGGRHLYFRASGYANSAGKLAPGLDIRGEGGYVVAPSSTLKGFYQPKMQEYTEDDACGLGIWVDGTYTIEDGCDAIEMPDWLHEALASRRVKAKPGDKGRVIIEDDPADIEAAIEWLQECEIAVEGAGGDNHTYITFCKLKERGLSQQTALELAWEHWNVRCSPPWDYDELEKKSENAYKSAQNATGVKSATAEFNVPILPPQTGLSFELLKPSGRFLPADIPPRQWALGDLAIRGQLTIIAAAGGIGKSTLSIGLALSKATGRDILGINPRGQERVAIYNNEDGMEELRRRTAAMMQAFGISWEEMWDPDVLGKAAQPFLYLSSGEDHPFKIAERAAKSGKLKPYMADAMVMELVAKKIKVLIVDPLAETHPGKENENEEMGEVARMYRMIAQRADCAIILIHHTRKHDNASSEGHSGNLDTLRGASSLAGVVRFAFTLFTMNKKEAKLYGIDEKDCWRYMLLEQAKANMAPGDSNRMWFRKEGEILNPTMDNPDGESVGIVRRVYLQEIETMETVNPATRTLIADLEALVADAPMTTRDAAKALVAAFSFHSDKDPENLRKAIQRLFADNPRVQCNRGFLVYYSETGKAKSAMAIRLELNETANSIADML